MSRFKEGEWVRTRAAYSADASATGEPPIGALGRVAEVRYGAVWVAFPLYPHAHMMVRWSDNDKGWCYSDDGVELVHEPVD